MKIFLVFFAIVLIAAAMFFDVTGLFIGESVSVSRVIDGDTIVLESGEHVRLLSIDTPEKGQKLFEESKHALEEMLKGKAITLESTEEDKDKYDRLLRYVFADNINTNLELVKAGYATSLIYNEDKYTQEILEAEEKARSSEEGIWKYPESYFCVGIFYLKYNAFGNDRDNLNDEYITLRNRCNEPVNLSGWLLSDKKYKTYEFHNIILQNKSTISLHTGTGDDNATDLYWSSGIPVWNNDGDSVMVWNNNNELVIEYSYE